MDLPGNNEAMVSNYPEFIQWIQQTPLCQWLFEKEYSIANQLPWPPDPEKIPPVDLFENNF